MSSANYIKILEEVREGSRATSEQESMSSCIFEGGEGKGSLNQDIGAIMERSRQNSLKD